MQKDEFSSALSMRQSKYFIGAAEIQTFHCCYVVSYTVKRIARESDEIFARSCLAPASLDMQIAYGGTSPLRPDLPQHVCSLFYLNSGDRIINASI